MRYLNIISYLYLGLAALFTYDAIMRLRNGQDAVISFIFAAIGIFMFFFRRKYGNKFKNRQNPE